jgi:hypothetical protein
MAAFRADAAKQSKRISVAHIAPLGNNPLDNHALVSGLDQRRDQVDLVRGYKLKDFAAHLAERIARQRFDDL